MRRLAMRTEDEGAAPDRRTQATYADTSRTDTYDTGNQLTQVTDSLSSAVTWIHELMLPAPPAV